MITATRPPLARESARQFSDRYRDYIGSKLWYLRRQWILNRDAHTCRMCLHRAAGHVHHRTYERLGNEHPDDLISVCGFCHAIITILSRATVAEVEAIRLSHNLTRQQMAEGMIMGKLYRLVDAL